MPENYLTDNLLIDTANKTGEVALGALQIAGKGVEAIDKATSLRTLGGPLTKYLPKHEILDTSYHDVRSAAVGKVREINPTAGFVADILAPNVIDLAFGAGKITKGLKGIKHGIKLTPSLLKMARNNVDNLLSPKLVTAGGPALPSKLAISTAEQFTKANPLMIKSTKGFGKEVATSGKVRRLANKVETSQVDELVQPDFSKPHRNIKQHTSKHTSVEDYENAWNAWPDKTKTGRDKFYKTHGVYLTEDGLKLKPNPTKDKNLFGPGMSTRLDAEAVTRKQRGSILTYLSGEKAVPLEKIRYKDASGTLITPHHRTSHGELAPWVDFIRSKLNSKDPRIQAEGKEMLEIGRKIFQKNNIKVGDTLANYEGYSRKAHLGKGSIHANLTEDVITGPSSQSAFNFTKGKNILSQGILHKGKRIPTKEYIQMLPWRKGVKNSEFGENTFWSTLVDYIQTSNVPRRKARTRVLKAHGPQGTNWSAKELNRLRKLKLDRQ